MKKNNKTHILISFFLSLLLCCLVAPCRGGYFSILGLTGFSLASTIGVVLYFILTITLLALFAKKTSAYQILLAVILGQSIIILPVHIIDFHATLTTFPEYFIILFSTLLGYSFFKIKNHWRYLVAVLGMSAALWLSIPGINYWLNYRSFGTFTGKIETSNSKSLNFAVQTSNNDTITIQDICTKKYLVLDCWYTNCGYCYVSFPKLQALHDRYKNSEYVSVYAMHFRMEEENENASTGKNILEKDGYNFPCVSIEIDDTARTDMGVQAFPTILILNKNSQLIFKGNIEGVEKYLDENLN